MSSATTVIVDPRPGLGQKIFGCAFAAFPLLMIVLAVVDGEGFPWGALPFLLVFLGAGALIAGIGKGIKADSQKRELLESWFYFGKPFKHRARAFDAFDRVEVHHEKRTSSNSDGGRKTYWVDVAYLVGPEERWKIKESKDPAVARAVSERLARSTSLAIHDHTGDEVVERQPDELDLSLRQRRRRSGERLTEPAQPSGSRLKLAHVGDGTLVHLPAPRILQIRNIVMLVPAVLIFGVLYSNVGPQLPAGPMRTLILGAAALPIGLSLAYTIGMSMAKRWVTITADGVVYRRAFGLAIARRMHADDIEQIGRKGQVVHITSDEGPLSIKVHSTEEDARYLCDYLAYRLG